jgi:hypothetical protein
VTAVGRTSRCQTAKIRERCKISALLLHLHGFYSKPAEGKQGYIFGLNLKIGRKIITFVLSYKKDGHR